jgi:L-lactate utilization protein LutB
MSPLSMVADIRKKLMHKIASAAAAAIGSAATSANVGEAVAGEEEENLDAADDSGRRLRPTYLGV